MLKFLLFTSLAVVVLAELRPEPRYLEEMSERVVNGENAKPHSWPWQISLQSRSFFTYQHICGGSLIQPGWVMTAAHCVESSFSNYRVVIGDHDLSLTSGREQIITVKFSHIHPLYDPNDVSFGYDVALLELSTAATLNSYAQLATLPPKGQILPHNNLCYITGWGRTATSGPLPDVLQQAVLPLVGHKECSASDWWGSGLKDILVCAGGGDRSGCNGDSGGPLNCLVNGKFVVHGIASFVYRFGCNYPKKPTVFTRVSEYIDWMDSIMKI